MALDDSLIDLGEISLASLAIPGASIAVSSSIYLPTAHLGSVPMWLVITCTETAVASGSAACRFALSAATADDAATLVAGYDLWIYGNMDFAGIFPKGIPYQSIVAGETLFQVPAGSSPLLTSSFRYLALNIMQVAAGAAITAGKVKAYLTSAPPHGGLLFPNAVV